MSFPDPVIEIAVEPKSKNDQEKMSAGLAGCCRRSIFRFHRPRIGADHNEGHG